MSLSNKILLGLAFGVICGVVWGPRMEQFEIVGQVFLGLLQMTVLPYIIVSLVSAVGSLSPRNANALARYSAIVLAMLWLPILLLIAVATLSFPERESASLFSPSLLEPAQGYDFLANFLPSNIFHALGDNAIPAVVIASLFLGTAILRLDRKDELLRIINSLQAAIGDVAGMIMKTAPIGVFAIAANAAGTLDIDSLKGLYVYLITLTIVCLLLTFGLFPLLVSSLTHIRYRDVIGVSKDALITAFASGSLFIVLPIIAERTRKLFLLSYEHTSHEANIVEVIVPAAFSLPVAGKLMALLFILFAGWFTGEPIALGDYPQLLLTGLVSLFGSPYTVVPDLLHSYKIPMESFQLFVLSENLVSNRLGAMTSVMFITAFAILVATGVTQKWHGKIRPLIRLGVAAIVLVIGLSLSLRMFYTFVGYDYTSYREYIARDLLLAPAPAIYTAKAPDFLPREPAGTTLQRIQQRKILRVGYYRDWLPYSFHNEDGKLVGLDVELWHQMARDLGVAVEFVLVYRNEVKQLLDSHYLDLAAGIAVTPSAISNFTLATPHAQENLAFLVAKNRRKELRDWQSIASNKRLHLGVPNAYYLTESVRQALPRWDVQEIASPRKFVRGEQDNLDAIIFGAAGASAWTLLYPQFGVVVPQPALPPIPMAMPTASNDLNFLLFVTQWINLQKNNGTIDKLNDYWIRGLPLHKEISQRWNLWDYMIDSASEGENKSEPKNP